MILSTLISKIRAPHQRQRTQQHIIKLNKYKIVAVAFEFIQIVDRLKVFHLKNTCICLINFSKLSPHNFCNDFVLNDFLIFFY